MPKNGRPSRTEAIFGRSGSFLRGRKRAKTSSDARHLAPGLFKDFRIFENDLKHLMCSASTGVISEPGG